MKIILKKSLGIENTTIIIYRNNNKYSSQDSKILFIKSNKKYNNFQSNNHVTRHTNTYIQFIYCLYYFILIFNFFHNKYYLKFIKAVQRFKRLSQIYFY